VGEDAAATGDLDIIYDLTVVGADQATTIIDGGQLDRVFHIHPGAMVSISGVTITNGRTADGTVGGQGGTSGFGGSGGGAYNAGDPDTFKFKSTIIAGNTTLGDGPDCSGSITSHGCNLVGDNTDCFAPTTGDQVGVDPLLGPLQNNGGPAETHELLSGSPAIDAVSDECGCTTIGDSPEAVSRDQRGEPRPMKGAENGGYLCDIGAYETPLNPYDRGYQAGLKACSKMVGGAGEPVDLAELNATDNQLSGDNNNHARLALWAGLASALAIGGGIFILRRRRAH